MATISRARSRALKFEDEDGNGSNAADPNDQQLVGWTIEAYADGDANGTLSAGEAGAAPAASAVTDSNGAYTLTLDPGKYVICEQRLNTTWFQSAPSNTKCDLVVGAAKGGHAVTVTSGSSDPGKDFGNFRQGTVSGLKFEDKNANGVKDAGDGGLDGWTIYVDYNANSTKDSGEPSAVTSGGGTYTISGVDPGSWKLREVAQSGWTCSYPSPCSHAINVISGGSVTGKEFGNWTTGSVSGVKFEDKNSSGTKDAGDGVLAGWIIKAYKDDGDGTLSVAEGTAAAVASTTTAANGSYTLNLDPGTYVICEKAQTNWLQTTPNPSTNTKCKNVMDAAPGGYAVTVTSSSSATDKDFGNAGFGSGSTMTNSAFDLVDNLDPWTISDFEILLNSKNVIVATNPGQFYYHQRATNTSGSSSSMQFTINWPCQFQTQIAGGQPIHAYVQLAGDAPNTWRDWTPQSSNITWTNTNTDPACSKTTTVGPLGTGTITPNNVPAGAKVWVTVHLDYALKTTTASSNNFGNPPILYKPFQSTITMAGGNSYSSTSLLGRGKKVTVIYGRMTHKTGGAAMPDVWVKLTQGSNTALALTDGDGNYVVYDGQQCLPADGLQSCAGASTSSWVFGSGGNVTTKLDIMGEGGTSPAGAPTYPSTKSNGTVFSGSTTFATLGALPSYTFGVAKSSAYNRDWKFGP